MEDILNILEIFRSDLSLNDKINKLGIVKKSIGSITFISPSNQNIEGMSFVILNDKINSLGLVLKKAINFEIVTNELTNEYVSLYNHYDGETVVNFKIDDLVLLNCTLDGYIEKDNLFKTQVSRFNFKSLESPRQSEH
jgi:hypothetical protein